MSEWASIDLESRSTVDLRKSGVYAYAEHETTDVWTACWALDDGPVETWFPGQPMPAALAAHIAGGGKIRAWNSQFERTLWREILTPRYGWPEPGIEQFWCTAAQAAAMSLPRALDNAADALGLPIRKDREGQTLMMRMARPRKIEPDGTITWWDDPARIQRLAEYCARDVEVERMIAGRLRQLPPDERAVFLLDQTINDRGVLLDLPLIEKAQALAVTAVTALNERLRQATGGKVNSATKAAALTTWLREQGVEADGVSKQSVNEMLAGELVAVARDALEIRKEAAKASTAKLKAMQASACQDSRVRGLLLYHGAGTGRWAGKLVQPQNFPRGKKGAELAIPLILGGDLDVLEILFGPALDVISSNLRGCLVAAPGHQLIAADYSNIEGRVNAWLAGEHWKVRAFADFDAGTGPDLYKLAYGKSFRVPIDAVSGDQRQVGKVMELALGFQGGVGAFQSMAGLYGLSISDEEADALKTAWRDAHPATQSFWRNLEAAATRAVEWPGQVFQVVGAAGQIRFVVKHGFLWMVLPSGRALAYPQPKIEPTMKPWGDVTPSVTFWGVNSMTKRWEKQVGYGGLWCENAVQATARDVMAAAMLRLEAQGYRVVLTVHDEIVNETPIGRGSVGEVEQIMCVLPSWATGLPIAASGWAGQRYRK